MIDEEYEKQQIEFFKKGYKAAKMTKSRKESSRYFDLKNEENIISSRDLKRSLLKDRDSLALSDDDEAPTVVTSPTSYTIIDKRGPEDKVLTNLEEFSQKSHPVAKSDRFPELTSNIQYLLRLTEKEISDSNNLLRKLKNTRQQSLKEKETLDRQTSFYQEMFKHHQEIVSVILQIKNMLKGVWSSPLASASLPLIKKLEQLVEIEQDFSFKNFINETLFSLFIPYLKPQFAQWFPLENPSWFENDSIEILITLGKIDTHLNRKGSHFKRSTMTLLDTILLNLMLPRVRSSINNPYWNMENPYSLAEMLTRWWPAIHPNIQKQIMDELIVPKMISFIDDLELSNSSDLTRIYIPFSDLLSPEAKKEITNHICIKLQMGLGHWHPSEARGYDLVSSWAELMEPSLYYSLLSKIIIPKLELVLRNEFVVDPKNQDLRQLEWVFQWGDVMPLSTFVSILENEFFPKWMSMLYLWITSEPQYEQIITWYLSWKSVFPSELMAHPAVQLNFRRGLDLMNGMLDNPSLPLDAFLLKKLKISK